MAGTFFSILWNLGVAVLVVLAIFGCIIAWVYLTVDRDAEDKPIRWWHRLFAALYLCVAFAGFFTFLSELFA